MAANGDGGETEGRQGEDILATIRRQYEKQREAEEQQSQQQLIDFFSSGTASAKTEDPPAECTLFFCGSPNSGKSSLSSLFLSSLSSRHFSSSSALPSSLTSDQKTIALEFRFGHRIISGGNVRQLVNVWELAGGGTMAPLAQIPLAKRNIQSTSLLLFVDLTRPELFQSVADTLLTICRKRIDAILPSDKVSQPIDGIATQDGKAIRPLGVQLAIVCARYDEFQNSNSEQKRQTYRLIRQFAHTNGAAIITLSIRMDSLLTKARLFLVNLLSAPLHQFQKSVSTDHQQPLFVVPHGADSFEDINPSLRSLNSFSEAMLNFLQTLNQTFAQQQQKSQEDEAEDGADEDEATKQQQLAEPTIDALVEERMRQLELFAREKRDQKEAEKRAADRRN